MTYFWVKVEVKVCESKKLNCYYLKVRLLNFVSSKLTFGTRTSKIWFLSDCWDWKPSQIKLIQFLRDWLPHSIKSILYWLRFWKSMTIQMHKKRGPSIFTNGWRHLSSLRSRRYQFFWRPSVVLLLELLQFTL